MTFKGMVADCLPGEMGYKILQGGLFRQLRTHRVLMQREDVKNSLLSYVFAFFLNLKKCGYVRETC